MMLKIDIGKSVFQTWCLIEHSLRASLKHLNNIYILEKNCKK